MAMTCSGAGGIIDGVPYVLAMSGTFAPGHNGELYPHLRALAPAALADERGRMMRRHAFETDVLHVRLAPRRRRTRGPGHHREPQLRPCCASELPPTSPASPCARSPRRYRRSGTRRCRLPREDVQLDELAAIADIEDEERPGSRHRRWRRPFAAASFLSRTSSARRRD